MRQVFNIIILCAIAKIGFAQNNDCTATIQILTPVSIFNDISSFCVEYKTDSVTAWTHIYVTPQIQDLTEDESYVQTHYELTGLTSNTQYFVRVHALLFIENNIYWGRYGNTITFYTPEGSGHVGDIPVPCGSLVNPYSSHPDITSNFSLQELPERILYRSKEEWEQLC